MKTVIGMAAFILTCVVYATTHDQFNADSTTVVIEYVGKSDRPIFPIIISSSNNEAEWYRKKLFGDPISEFAHIHIVKRPTLKEVSGILSRKVDFDRPVASDLPRTAPTIKLIVAIEHDFKEITIGSEDSVVVLAEIKKRVPKYPLLVRQLSEVESPLNQYFKSRAGIAEKRRGEKGAHPANATSPVVRSWSPPYRTLEDDILKLYGDNDGSRREAAQRLREAGADSIPLLVPVLCDKSKLHFDRAWPVAAKVLGELKAEAAAPCLVQMLGYNYPPIGSPISKTDETLRDVDPAFAALVQIGAPGVPAIRSHLPLLHPEHSLMAIRILRIINTPAAKEAAGAYIKLLEDQIRLTKQVVAEFGKDRDSYLK